MCLYTKTTSKTNYEYEIFVNFPPVGLVVETETVSEGNFCTFPLSIIFVLFCCCKYFVVFVVVSNDI